MSGRGSAFGAWGALGAALLAHGARAADLPAAQPHGFSAQAEKAQVRLGEPFRYAIEIRHDPAEQYAIAGEPALEPFEATPLGCSRNPKAPGEVVTTCTLRLALFDLGEHDVPEIALTAHTPGGDRILRVPGARVTGMSMLDPNVRTEDLQLRDIAPPVPVMVRSYRLLAWALGALAAAALAVFGYRLWKRRSRPAAEVSVLLPHERFERQLDALEAEFLPRQGRGRAYFFRLSEMVREYIGALCAFNALDLTTEEILHALAQRPPGTLDRPALALFSRKADLVKFARSDSSESDCSEAMAFARELLARTRPPPEPQTSASAPAP